MDLLGDSFQRLDDETLNLIIQCQLEDGEHLAAGAKGKQREGTVSDAEFALQLYTEELKQCNVTLADRHMAQSIVFAVLADGELLHDAYRLERQAEMDRDLAARLTDDSGTAGSGAQGASGYLPDSDPWNDDEMLSKVAAIYMPDPETGSLSSVSSCKSPHNNSNNAESSGWAASRKNFQEATTHRTLYRLWR